MTYNYALYVDYKEKKSILTLPAVDYLCANRYSLSVQCPAGRGLSAGYVDDSQGTLWNWPSSRSFGAELPELPEDDPPPPRPTWLPPPCQDCPCWPVHGVRWLFVSSWDSQANTLSSSTWSHKLSFTVRWLRDNWHCQWGMERWLVGLIRQFLAALVLICWQSIEYMSLRLWTLASVKSILWKKHIHVHVQGLWQCECLLGRGCLLWQVRRGRKY